ncbi:MAG: hypothetical protein GC201_08045 [Alphaproteobacteria bacterium]|nr:hypothetical protein [Alphaproteobacteria bacterium]
MSGQWIGSRAAGVLAAGAVVTLLSALPVPAQDSPWDSIGTKRTTGTTEGSFEGDKQTAGSYAESVTVYLLNDGGNGEGDWYRIDMSIESAISKFRVGGVCGWFTDTVNAAFSLKTSGGEIWEYGPPGTISSRSTGYSMGFKLNSMGGPKMAADYSVSQTVPDAGIKVDYNSAAGRVSWKAALGDCGVKRGTTGDAIGFKNPPLIARNSFVLRPSILVMVPEGKKLEFSTEANGATNGIVLTKSKIASGYPSKIKDRKAIYDFVYTVSCSTKSCTFNRTVNYKTK